MKGSFLTTFLVLALLGMNLPAFGQGNPQNQRDEQGRRQGSWQGTYPSGRVRYQGQFIDDRPTGTFRYFHNDGSLRAELFHTPGNDTVSAVYFHRNRQRMALGQFVNNQRVGPWRFFSDMGVKLAENNYENGALQGKSVTFFPGGAIAETVEYMHNEKDGAWIQYFEDGSIRLTTTYSQDKLNGPFKLFNQNGKLLLEATYCKSLPDGTWKFFSDQGELEKEAVYKAGALVYETIYIERETEITIPLKPAGAPSEDVFRSPF